ncbi:MAG TPA: LolA-related protein [Acetobacteraceae bacterium]|nr:LolA-related protein [Acetobacteraceae bacterium]
MRRRVVLALPLLAAAPARAAPLDDLMRGFAAVRTSRARFTEEKTMPELDLPLPSRGTLRWQAPDRLEKHTTEPVEEILRIEGETLTLERPARGERQSLALDRAPEIRPLVEALRATLAGDAATLRRHHEVTFFGNVAAWEMVLVPLSPRTRAVVQRVTLTGRNATVRVVETQGSGGTSRMVIEPLP